MPKIEPGDVVMVKNPSEPYSAYLGFIGIVEESHWKDRVAIVGLEMANLGFGKVDLSLHIHQCELTLLEKHHAKV